MNTVYHFHLLCGGEVFCCAILMAWFHLARVIEITRSYLVCVFVCICVCVCVVCVCVFVFVCVCAYGDDIPVEDQGKVY